MRLPIDIFPAVQIYRLNDPCYRHNKMAQLCLHYLWYDDFIEERELDAEEIMEKIFKYKFLSCSALRFEYHAACSDNVSRTGIEYCNELLNSANRKWFSYLEAADSIETHFHFDIREQECRFSRPNTLYLTARCGFVDTIQILLQRGEDVNFIGGQYGYLLGAAAAYGHAAALELLITNHADVNLEAGRYDTALGNACTQGYRRIVDILVRHWASVDQSAEDDNTPLTAVVQRGRGRRKDHEMITRMLLGASANVKNRDASDGRMAEDRVLEG